MSVLLYGVTDADAPDTEGAGLGDRPLRTVTHDNLCAVVSDLDAAPASDEPSLWAYEQVVERLMAGATVLPARFGTTASDDDQITAMLAERQSELTETLARVRDAVEFAVRAPTQIDDPPHTDDDPARPGTAYIERLLAQDRRFRDLDAVASWLISAKQRTGRGTAYLIDRGDADEFVAHARDLGLTVTGPWPPYSFTTPS
jgi:gas vesicle protein GvpL/GvpF